MKSISKLRVYGLAVFCDAGDKSVDMKGIDTLASLTGIVAEQEKESHF